VSDLTERLRNAQALYRGGIPAGVIELTVAAAERISTLEALTDQLAEALDDLEHFDMLTLRPDGSGEVMDDAPWARQLIRHALRAYEADKEAHR
jgi:hypothetical protein